MLLLSTKIKSLLMLYLQQMQKGKHREARIGKKEADV
jgi:hypothetical protein